jgi:threonine dehydratase
MPKSLFMFLMEAVAGAKSQYRPGARHALLVFIVGGKIDDSQQPAIECLERQGWHFVEAKRAKEVSADTEQIADETLREAANHALANGDAIIVYQDEIPNNS